jgi:hypothetical protein
LLEGDAEGRPRACRCRARREGLEEGQLLKLGLLEVVEEGFAEALGDADGELEGRVDGSSDEGLEEGPLLN